jgi:hypothetical protein
MTTTPPVGDRLRRWQRHREPAFEQSALFTQELRECFRQVCGTCGKEISAEGDLSTARKLPAKTTQIYLKF